jgi:hypothetical protein
MSPLSWWLLPDVYGVAGKSLVDESMHVRSITFRNELEKARKKYWDEKTQKMETVQTLYIH